MLEIFNLKISKSKSANLDKKMDTDIISVFISDNGIKTDLC